MSCAHPNTTGLGLWGDELAQVLGKAEKMEKVHEKMEKKLRGEKVILE